MHLSQHFSMDQYGIYVWATYGITLFVFGINLFLTFYEKHRIKKMVMDYLSQWCTKNHES